MLLTLLELIIITIILLLRVIIRLFGLLFKALVLAAAQRDQRTTETAHLLLLFIN